MKPSDYPEQDARTVPFQAAEKETALARRGPDPETRYLEVPKSAESTRATRNLTLGIILLAVAAVGYWLGLHYAGATATRTLAACLLTFGVVWVLMQLSVLRQRHGILFAFGLVALIGTAIPFVEGGFRRLDDLAREGLAGRTESPMALSVPPPVPTTATAPPAPPTIPMPTLDADEQAAPPAAATARAVAQAAPAEVKKAPLATKPAGTDPNARELIVPEPPEGTAKLIRVKEDVKVELDGRPTIIRGGTVAPFKDLNDGQVTFLAGDHEISIDMSLVTFTGASKEKPEEITRLAEIEVMTRYPNLREQDSRENILFVTRVKELRLDPEMKAVFFQDPKWPLVLAEQLAQQENWVRADLKPEDKEASEAEVPANEMPADASTESLLPPGAPPIPQESAPLPSR